MGFRKQQSGGTVGLLLKTILTRSTLHASSNMPSLFDQFKFLSKPEIVQTIEYGAELWMILKKMHQTACNRLKSPESSHLKMQFEAAHTFFVSRIQEHNKLNQKMFSGVLDILQASK